MGALTRSRTFALENSETSKKKKFHTLVILSTTRDTRPPANDDDAETRVVRTIKSEIDARIVTRNTRSFHFFISSRKSWTLTANDCAFTTLTRDSLEKRARKIESEFRQFPSRFESREARAFIKRSSKNFREKKTKKNRNK